jgi:hypothetical protein
VVNQVATFEWGTDVDIVHGKLWITNYLLNLGTSGLGAVWEKAKIRVPLLAPIAPHEIFCHRYLINAFRDEPDRDAPIIYGTNRQREEAAAFVAQSLTQPLSPLAASGAETTSIIETTVRDRAGEPRPIHVEVTTRRTPKGVKLFVHQPADLVIGLSLLATALTTGEERFNHAQALARAGKTEQAIALLEKLCEECRTSWIDRASRERLAKLRAAASSAKSDER